MIPAPLGKWLSAPIFPEDKEKNHQAKILHTFLWGVSALLFCLLPFYLNSLWRLLVPLILFMGFLYFLHRGYVYVVQNLLIIFIAIFSNSIAWTAGGVQSPGFYANIVVVVCASLFYRRVVLIFIISLGLLNGLLMTMAARYDILPVSRVQHSPELFWLVLTGVILTLAVVTQRTRMHLQHTIHDAQRELEERWRAEYALRESEERYRQLVELSPSGIFVHQDGELVYVNQAGIDLMGGITAKDLLDRPVLDYVHPDYRAVVQQRIQQAIQEGQPSPFVEEQFLRLDGSTIEVRAAAIPIIHQGQPAVQVVALDISAQKRAEDEIRSLNAELEARVKLRTAELESANRELKDFAYVVSHDLKAPLRAISRLTSWLREDYTVAFDEKGNEMIDLLLGRVQRMDLLIDGILEYSRIGRIESAHAAVDLNTLVTEVLDTLVPPESVHVSVVNPLPTLLLSKVRIFQVFQNLIENAIKFADQASLDITIDCVSEGRFWKFSVSDNGPGIDPRYHEKVFQIFQTLRPRDEIESTGIGLTLVKKIVTFYGGAVGVESAPGTGCRFWFTLPQQSVV